MEEFKGTKIQHYVDNDDVTNYVFCDENGNRLAATLETAERNTKIFNEAFSVVTRTGLTPEQMEDLISQQNANMEAKLFVISTRDKTISDLEARLKEACELIEKIKRLEPLWMPIDFNEEHFNEGQALSEMKHGIDSFLTKEKTK